MFIIFLFIHKNECEQNMSNIAITDIKRVRDYENKYCQTKKEHNYFKIFSHYIQSGSGTYNFFRVLIYACLWPIHFAGSFGFSDRTVNKLLSASEKFKFIKKNLLITKYPKDIVNLDKSYRVWLKTSGNEIAKKRGKLALRVAETVADSGFLIQSGEILSLYSLKALSPVVNLTSNFFAMFRDGYSLKINADKYFKHDKMQKIIKNGKNPSKRSISLFQEIKNLDAIYIAKTVMQLALSVLLIFDIIFQTAVLSAVTLLVISTCSAVLAIWAHFYKESMTYPVLRS